MPCPRRAVFSVLLVVSFLLRASAGETAPAFDWKNASFAGEGLDFFPPETICAIGTKNGAQLLRLLQESAAGKVLAGDSLAPARKALQALAQNSPLKTVEPLLGWLGKVSGSAAVGVWKVEPQKLLEMEAGAVFEITAPDPEAVYAEFLQFTGADQFTPLNSRDGLAMKVRLLGFAAVARAGKYLLLGTNKVALEKMAAALKAGRPAGLTTTERYKKAAQDMPAAALQFAFSYRHYLELLQRMPDGEARYAKEVLLGRDQHDLVLYSLCPRGDQFDEKYVTLYRETGDDRLPGDIELEETARSAPPLVASPDQAARVPHNALFSAQFDLNGEALSLFLDQYLSVAEEYLRTQVERVTRRPYAGDDLETVLHNFEALVGMTIDDLLQGLDGRHALWMLPPVLLTPDFGMSLSCRDAAAAKKLAADLDAVLKKALDDADAVFTEKAGERTIYTLDTTTFGERLKRVPYKLSWCALDAQLACASSPVALKRYLEMADKLEPMLAANPQYLKTFEGRSAAEKDGQTLYVDLKTSMALLQRFLLPVAGMLEPQLVPLILELPPPDKLFGELAPLVSYSVEQHEPWRQIVTIRSPLPVGPSLLAIVGAALALPGQAPRSQRTPPARNDK